MTEYDIEVTATNSAGMGPAATTTGNTTPTPPPGSRTWVWGYGGGGNQLQSTVVAEEAWMGCNENVRNGTLTTSISGLNFNGYAKNTQGNFTGMIVSMEMLYNGWDSSGATINDLAVAAAGGYNATWTSMLTALKALNIPIFALRPGWEPNGNWMGWSPGGNLMSGGQPPNKNCTPANYVGAFRQIAQLVRKILPGTLVEWNTNYQGSNDEWGSNPPDFFPGKFDPVNNPGGCDCISMDLYQKNIGNWAACMGGAYGVQWLTTFAAQNKLPVCFSEIGIGAGNGETGGGNTDDDPVFVQDLLAYIEGQLPNFWYLYIAAWPPCLDLSAAGLAPQTQAVLSGILKGSTWANPGWYTGTALPGQGASPPPVNLPGAPSNLREASATANSLTIAWDPPTTGGALDAGEYTLGYRVTGTTTWTNMQIPFCTPGKGTISFGGQTWSITPGGVIQYGTTQDTRTSGVTFMLAANGLLWQLNNAGNWYSTPGPGGGTWSAGQTQSPLDAGVLISGLS